VKTRFILPFALLLGLSLDGIAAPLHPLWKARQPNSPGTIALDSQGNTFLVTDDSRLVKRDARRRLDWSVPLPDIMFVNSMTPDRDGNLYLTGGRYRDGAQEIVTARYTAAGSLEWQTTYSGTAQMSEIGGNIGLDELGNIYVVGRAYVLTNAFNENYHLFLGYTADGALRWERLEPSLTGSALNMVGMAVNPLGGVAAITKDSIAACSADGTLLWTWQSERDSLFDLSDKFITALESSVSKVAAYDRSSQLYVIGTSLQGGQGHPALQKHAPDGFILHEVLTPLKGQFVDIRVDAEGHAYVGMDAAFGCHTVYDGDESWEECKTQPVLLKFNPSAGHEWISRFVHRNDPVIELAGIDLDASGRCVFTARNYTSGTMILGLCDPRGNQIWGGTFQYPRSQRTLWAMHPDFDNRNGIRAPAELIDYTTSQVDVLLTRFYPFILSGAPRIVQVNGGGGVNPGGTAILNVSATGKGKLRYQWRFNGHNITGANRPKLEFKNFSAAQAGFYSVEIRNYQGTTVTPEIQLELNP